MEATEQPEREKMAPMRQSASWVGYEMEDGMERKFRYGKWKMPNGMEWKISRIEWKTIFHTSKPIPYYCRFRS